MAGQTVEPAEQKQNQSGGKGTQNRETGVPEMIAESFAGLKKRVENAKSDAREGEGIGKAHGFRVHDGEAEEQETEDGGAEAGEGEAEAKKAEQEERRGGQLNGGIAPGDAPTAGTAAAAEQDPAEEGDVVGGTDGDAAARAS